MKLTSRFIFRPGVGRPGVIDKIERVCPRHGKYTALVIGEVAEGGTAEKGPYCHEHEMPCPVCKEEAARAEVARIYEEGQWKSTYAKAGVPEKYKTVSLHGYQIYADGQQEAVHACLDWVGGKFYNLIACGRTRTGKTHLLCSSLRGVAMHHDSVLYAEEADILRSIKSSYSDNNSSEYQIINKYKNVKYLVIDEMGRSQWTNKDIEILSDIILKRHAELKYTALATNLLYDELKNRFDDAIWGKLEASSKAIIGTWESFPAEKEMKEAI